MVAYWTLRTSKDSRCLLGLGSAGFGKTRQQESEYGCVDVVAGYLTM